MKLFLGNPLSEEEEKPHSGHISMSGTSEDSDGLELFIQGQQPQKGIILVMGKKETECSTVKQSGLDVATGSHMLEESHHRI